MNHGYSNNQLGGILPHYRNGFALRWLDRAINIEATMDTIKKNYVVEFYYFIAFISFSFLFTATAHTILISAVTFTMFFISGLTSLWMVNSIMLFPIKKSMLKLKILDICLKFSFVVGLVLYVLYKFIIPYQQLI